MSKTTTEDRIVQDNVNRIQKIRDKLRKKRANPQTTKENNLKQINEVLLIRLKKKWIVRKSCIS